MAWQDEMGELLRVMVTDLSDPPLYPDASVERLLVGAAHIVEGEMTFSHTYYADLSNTDIVPDPTDADGGTRDENFINLVCMRAAAMIEASVVRSESGIVIRDNGSMVDLRGKLDAALAMVRSGFRAEYNRLKFEYRAGVITGVVVGAAVMGPFRALAGRYFGRGDSYDFDRYFRED